MAETKVQHLLPHHEELLAASGISGEVAQARRYFSAISVEELSALGFADYQCRVPALAIPVWTVRGKIAFHQIRPDPCVVPLTNTLFVTDIWLCSTRAFAIPKTEKASFTNLIWQPRYR